MSTAARMLYRPAFASRPHLLDPLGQVACWYTEPAGVVMQLTYPSLGTVAMTDWIAGPGKDLLLARFPVDELLTVVFDMTLMTGREPAARNALVEPAKAMKARMRRVIICPPQQVSRVYLGSLYAATALLSVFGYRVDLEPSLDDVLRKHAIRLTTR